MWATARASRLEHRPAVHALMITYKVGAAPPGQSDTIVGSPPDSDNGHLPVRSDGGVGT